MEKEIKFKVWDTKQNIFLEEVPCVESWIGNDCWDDAEDASPYDWTTAPTHNGRLIWLQFINSTDTNGKEVYDGDILEAPSGNKFIVKWYDEEMRWVMFSKDTWYNMNMKLHKVIGNIFENPELIS